jgi:hypothetical protein
MIDCDHHEFTETCGTCWFKKGMAEKYYDRRISCFNMALTVFETKINIMKENTNEKHTRTN